jgi:hypothetical protein
MGKAIVELSIKGDINLVKLIFWGEIQSVSKNFMLLQNPKPPPAGRRRGFGVQMNGIGNRLCIELSIAHFK